MNYSTQGLKYNTHLIKNFKVTPNKTFTADVCDKIPKDMLIHFIRGYFDGDGSITKTTTITVSFVGTFVLLNKLSQFFKNNFDVKIKSKNDTPPIQKSKNILMIDLTYSNRSDTFIYNRLYKNYNELSKTI